MLSCVRPWMRHDDSRRPVWEFADRVHITQSVLEAQWKALVVPGPVSPTVAPYSPSARPHILAIVVSLRRRGRSSVGATFDQKGPDDAGHLVGQSDRDQHFRLASQHLRKPDPLRSLPSAGCGIFQLGRTCHSFPCGWSAEVCQHRPLVSSRQGAGLLLVPKIGALCDTGDVCCPDGPVWSGMRAPYWPLRPIAS